MQSFFPKSGFDTNIFPRSICALKLVAIGCNKNVSYNVLHKLFHLLEHKKYTLKVFKYFWFKLYLTI